MRILLLGLLMLVLGALGGTTSAFAAAGTSTSTSASDDHGNSPLTATPIATDGSLVMGCIEEPGDVDYFLFQAVSGRNYEIRTSHLTPEMDTIIYLFDTDGQTILAVDDNSGGGKASLIDWACPRDGTYFVMVRHAQATKGTGCYALSISVLQADDHGDDPTTATPLTTDGTPVAGYIERPGDVDYFLFQAEAGWNYLIETSNLSVGMDTVITLYATDGRTVLATDDDSGGDGASRIEWTCHANGTYFIAVRHKSAEGTGGYQVSVKRLGYTDDYGNDPSAAAPLATDGSLIRGRIEVPGDVDYFYFSAHAEGRYTLTARGEIRLRLELYGPEGRLLEAFTGKEIKEEWTCPASGQYYLALQAATGGTGGYELSVSAALRLQEVGAYKSPGYALDVWVEGDKAYVVLGFFGLLIIDVSDPANPREIGAHSTQGYAQSVQVVGRRAYIADRGNGLTIIDVSNPAAPEEVGGLETPGSAYDLFVAGHYAYIADYKAGLAIVDVSNPARPELVSEVPTAGDAQGVYTDGGYAYVALGGEGLEVIDITNPEEPRSVAHYKLPGEAHAVLVRKGRAYVASGYRGVYVLDVSDPTDPRLLGGYDTRGEAVDLFLQGNLLFVADRDAGLLVLNVSDPQELKEAGKLDTPGSAMSVFVAGDHVYIADKEEGLRIVALLP